MKKFRKVLDGLTTSSPGGTIGSPSCGSAAGTPTAAPTPKEIDVQETLVSENFQLCKTVRHGFPYQPMSLAFDPVQKILAIGSRSEQNLVNWSFALLEQLDWLLSRRIAKWWATVMKTKTHM
ncbi:syntaxin-binding protein 5-like [Gambusia affinis]|uniref:syntaxin-binding protein 5-like n=1 Tax=Gambusia affinis TaxID=33528 RepID=UPI001CDCB785|nr:syntaxin-binding protein 5-like [Gambusia affinis]